jgi:hypothetical protein
MKSLSEEVANLGTIFIILEISQQWRNIWVTHNLNKEYRTDIVTSLYNVILISFAFETAALHISKNECGHLSNEILMMKTANNRNKGLGE